jgi:hypothetical protein
MTYQPSKAATANSVITKRPIALRSLPTMMSIIQYHAIINNLPQTFRVFATSSTWAASYLRVITMNRSVRSPAEA